MVRIIQSQNFCSRFVNTNIVGTYVFSDFITFQVKHNIKSVKSAEKSLIEYLFLTMTNKEQCYEQLDKREGQAASA